MPPSEAIVLLIDILDRWGNRTCGPPCHPGDRARVTASEVIGRVPVSGFGDDLSGIDLASGPASAPRRSLVRG